MEEKKIEGLLLQAIPYLGKQKILKILTPTSGLLTVMSKKKECENLTTPFLIAEWVIRRRNGEIHSLIDATLLNEMADLRKNYESIKTAGLMAQNLLKSQFPEKPGSGPYNLACAYLQKIALNPETLLASFRLKLLLHDGHLGEEEFPIPFSSEEKEILHQLTFVRQFHSLQSLKIDKHMQEKIEQLFLSFT